MPRYGWIGDDFTGATDTLATIAERGHRAFLFLDAPDRAMLDAAGPLAAVGIATATRTLKNEALRDALRPLARVFDALGVRLLHYKCCSTFDSAPETGNLAVALEALKPFRPDGPAIVLGGQPSLRRYCAFSNLFAAAGGDVHRLDRHPTMSRHPATPMGEADLRKHLASLGLPSVHGIHWPDLEDPQALRAQIAAEAAEAEAEAEAEAILFDALTQRHVEIVGDHLRQRPGRTVAIGSSSVAEAFFEDRDGERDDSRTRSENDGPVLALAGSLSPATREQVAAATAYERIPAQADRLATSDAYRSRIAALAAETLSRGRNVLVTTVPTGDDRPARADEALAQRSALLVDDILDRRPLRRLLVAGGDTSSRVIQALGIWGLSFSHRAGQGVCVCRSRSARPDRDGMLVLLKGGQMGAATLFDDFALDR